MPYEVIRRPIPDGREGTLRSADEIMQQIRIGTTSWDVRHATVKALNEAGIQGRDYEGETRAIFYWVKRNLPFRQDPVGDTELIHSAAALLRLMKEGAGGADCDDHVILLGAMLRTVGIPVRLVLLGNDHEHPRLWNHIYLEAQPLHGGSWMALDTTVPSAYPGWAPQNPLTIRKLREIR